MKKRVLALTLAMVVAVSATAGCGGGSGAETSGGAETTATAAQGGQTETQGSTAGTAAESESPAETADRLPDDYFAGTTLNIVSKLAGNDYCADYNEKKIFQLTEEATGIHVNWTLLSSSAFSEQVNIMLSSGEMPDAFLGSVGDSTVGRNMELFYDLSEEGLLDTYAPDVVRTVKETYANGMDAITWATDGSIRSLPTGRVDNSMYDQPTWFMMINTTWLDRVGKEMPKTTDELYDVLCAFRDQDANGNGDPSDEIPFGFANQYGNAHIHQTANFFGIANAKDGDSGHYKMIKNGVVTPTADTPEWRMWLEYMHKLYADGLLDVEGFSQTSDEYVTKLQNDKFGVAIMYSPTHQNLNYKDWEILWVSGIDGLEPIIDGNKYRDNTTPLGLTISANCENVEALLHWWNYMHSSRFLKITSFYGEQGYIWDEYDGEYYWCNDWKDSDVIKEHPDWTNSEICYTLGLGGGRSALVSDVDNFENKNNYELYKGELIERDDTATMTASANRRLLVPQVWDWMQEEYMPIKFNDPDKVDERTFIETDLSPMMDNFLATSIVEGVTDASWDAYLNDLQNYGYYDWIAWYQGSYDGEY